MFKAFNKLNLTYRVNSKLDGSLCGDLAFQLLGNVHTQPEKKLLKLRI